MFRQIIVLMTAFVLFCSLSVQAKVPTKEELAEKASASKENNEAELAIEGFQIPKGTKASVFAGESMLANPCAFCIDEQGRFYIAETYRQERGVVDNRGNEHWWHDDLSAQTVEDRLALFKKHLSPEDFEIYGKYEDRIVRLSDTNGDGRADESTVYVDGFNNVVDGTGAGVLAWDGKVYYTCIPKLWMMEDANDDGKAEHKTALHHGYGVRIAFRGHDLHGLVLGPDGRIYFSIGDRGFNIKTPEGKHLKRPETGAVFRCNRDGSELEVFAYGLRNPQELAFDDFGNLFTCDNNSDSGDKARFVHVVEGGDTGWRMHYQYPKDRGPWNREKIWHTQHEAQPAYILPPITHLGDGPSGFTAYPGVGLSARYDNHFFLCDFRGTPSNSGIRSFTTKPKGASFDIDDAHKYIWGVLATDVDFGYDGSLYLTDWINGWGGLGRGRVYQFADEEHAPAAQKNETQKWISAEYAKLEVEQLVTLLSHADRRVRLKSQFELAYRKETNRLTALFNSNEQPLLVRIHSLWAIEQIARTEITVVKGIRTGLQFENNELRAQTAKVLGEAKDEASVISLAKLTADKEPRVRMMAAISLSKIGLPQATPYIVKMLVENNDQDPVLRHAGMLALLKCNTLEELIQLGKHSSRSVRVASVLAMRRLKAAEIAMFLNDSDAAIVLEAARAIHDEPIKSAIPELVNIELTAQTDDALARRVLNAHLILGEEARASKLFEVAVNKAFPVKWRLLALEALKTWKSPNPLDAVTGDWQPIAEREAAYVGKQALPLLETLLADSDDIRSAVIQLATAYNLSEIAPELEKNALNTKNSVEDRIASLQAVHKLLGKKSLTLIQQCLKDKAPRLRAASLTLLVNLSPTDSISSIQTALDSSNQTEQQHALAALGMIENANSVKLLEQLLKRWQTGELAPHLELELLTAIQKLSGSKKVQAISLKNNLTAIQTEHAKEPLGKYRVSLQGGDVERGRDLFKNKTSLSCIRCHKVAGRGGEVGPDLSQIGKQQTLEYLTEAIAFPNRKIAKGFNSTIIVTEEGLIEVGIVQEETEHEISLIKADGARVKIDKSTIDEQLPGKSAMPEDLINKMTLHELRDLVAYLKSLSN